MKKVIYLFLLMVCLLPLTASAHVLNTEHKNTDIVADYVYQKADLKGKIDYNVFKKAFVAYNKTRGKKKSLLTIIDYSKPSTEKRLYVFDLKSNKLLYRTYVSHGENSGLLMADEFSKRVNSHKTYLGTFLTEGTYNGGNGYSLKLNGLTRGENDNALKRFIVIHGAKYVSKSFIKRNGYLGRSWGCPAIPTYLTKKIINTIKGGSVIFAYA